MTKDNPVTTAVLVVCLGTLLLLTAGCSTLQPVNLPAEFTPSPSHNTTWENLDADHQQDWFVLLNEGPEALGWRLRAIDSATESIDLQTFLWTLDTTGRLIIGATANRDTTLLLLTP